MPIYRALKAKPEVEIWRRPDFWTFRPRLPIRPQYIMGSNLHRYGATGFNGPLSGTTQVSQYQKGKTNLDFSEARDSEWQWHRLDHMQVCTSLQTDNHANTSLLSFLQAGYPSCRPTNSIKALKATVQKILVRQVLNKSK